VPPEERAARRHEPEEEPEERETEEPEVTETAAGRGRKLRDVTSNYEIR